MAGSGWHPRGYALGPVLGGLGGHAAPQFISVVEWLIGFFSSRRRHTRYWRDWSSDVCSSDLKSGMHSHPAGVAITIAGARVRVTLRDGETTEVEFTPNEVRYMQPVEHAGEILGPGEDRKSVVSGKSVDLGGRRIIKKNNYTDI